MVLNDSASVIDNPRICKTPESVSSEDNVSVTKLIEILDDLSISKYREETVNSTDISPSSKVQSNKKEYQNKDIYSKTKYNYLSSIYNSRKPIKIIEDLALVPNKTKQESVNDGIIANQIDDLFFSTIPLSKTSTIDNYSLNTSNKPPCLLVNGWYWSPEKSEYFLASHSGRLKRKLYVSPKIYCKMKDYPHEYDGIRWLWERVRQGEGGILADEMGLGKTVQISCFIGALFRSELANFFLIILPVSLIQQWKEELNIWCPKIPVFIYHGSTKDRELALEELYNCGHGGILITTYDTLRHDESKLKSIPLNLTKCQFFRNFDGLKISLEQYTLEIKQNQKIVKDKNIGSLKDMQTPRNILEIPWDIVVVDEAHKLKNNKTKLFETIYRIQSHSKILCTGTPVQNRLSELWSLIQCVKPGLLGNTLQSFNNKYCRYLNKLGDKDLTIEEKTLCQSVINNLCNTTKPYILRRTKKIIDQKNETINKLNISDKYNIYQASIYLKGEIKKYDIALWHNLSAEQSSIYLEVLDSCIVRNILEFRELSAKENSRILEIISILLKICKHPAFVLQDQFQIWRTLLKDNNYLRCELQEQKVKINNLISPSSIAYNLIQTDINLLREQSMKLQILWVLVPALTARGHKILIFSESLDMLNLIELTILSPKQIKWIKLEGKVPKKQRISSIRSFNEQKDILVLLLSKQIGSIGLNLTTADRIIIVDPHWNPAQDDQAIGRAFRIGQKEDVVVYRLISSGAIEDWKFRLQIHKAGIAHFFLHGQKQKVVFTSEELAFIFSYFRPDSCETQNILSSISSDTDYYEKLKEDLGDEVTKLEPMVIGYLDCANI
ncbi:SNF2 family N-terminal domain-containing protein [Cryptosporidium andersoni]|uniref:SNF2 family N-terminal domain-containing protein n=1 Tax=Cryptosporidium andersoni TaxID=117008 RepID=A0A1J4MVF1_9CRYT|nr:SNF2 family N-terminal domain-containing protein [Cryptosporidium andersoni]